MYVDIYGKEGSLEDKIEDKSTIAMIPLSENSYLQVEITPEGNAVVESVRVPDTFTLTIEKER